VTPLGVSRKIPTKTLALLKFSELMVSPITHLNFKNYCGLKLLEKLWKMGIGQLCPLGDLVLLLLSLGLGGNDLNL